MAQKDNTIETLRGFAIIMLVAYHAAAMLPAGDSAYSYMGDSLAYIRMPLFTAISGFVYALRPVQAGNLFRFFVGKMRRLLLPLVTVAGLTFALREALGAGAGLANIWTAWVTSYEHFWFLQAVFLVFVAVALLERKGLLDRAGSWGTTVAVAIAVQLATVALRTYVPATSPAFKVFSLGGFLYLLPFFLLGIGLHRFSSMLRSPAARYVAWAVLLVGVASQQAAWFGLLPAQFGASSALAFAVGGSACALLFAHRREVTVLARLGPYAYTIYLFHGFGLAVAARLPGVAASEHVLFATGLALGIAVPMVLGSIVRRSPALSLVTLGLLIRPPTNRAQRTRLRAS